MVNNILRILVHCISFVVVLFVVTPSVSDAHCDTMDGPVISDARKALEEGDVNPVLKWVTKDNEREIRDSFERTLDVRILSSEARELADKYFFETLVRLHRAGEGAPYTGLKAAGSEIDPSVIASDKAIEDGSVDVLTDKISNLVSVGIRERFEKVLKAKARLDESLDTGREYVDAYIKFVHYVEKIHMDASGENIHHEHMEN